MANLFSLILTSDSTSHSWSVGGNACLLLDIKGGFIIHTIIFASHSHVSTRAVWILTNYPSHLWEIITELLYKHPKAMLWNYLTDSIIIESPSACLMLNWLPLPVVGEGVWIKHKPNKNSSSNSKITTSIKWFLSLSVRAWAMASSF